MGSARHVREMGVRGTEFQGQRFSATSKAQIRSFLQVSFVHLRLYLEEKRKKNYYFKCICRNNFFLISIICLSFEFLSQYPQMPYALIVHLVYKPDIAVPFS